MKLVLDANIFVSGYIWGGPPFAPIQRYGLRLDTLFITDDIIKEVEDVFKRPKFAVYGDRICGIMADIKKYGKMIAVPLGQRIKGVCSDPKDDKYLECALAAGADYIISGDNHLLTVKEYSGIKIVSAREYLDIVS